FSTGDTVTAAGGDGVDDGVRLGLGGDAGLVGGVVAAAVGALGVGGEGGVDEPVGLGLKGADLLLAPGEDGERGRLHAPERDGAVEGAAQPDGGGARGVHADDPVGLGARARGL